VSTKTKDGTKKCDRSVNPIGSHHLLVNEAARLGKKGGAAVGGKRTGNAIH